MRPKILIMELWGLGDLTFATPVVRAAVECADIHLIGKEHIRALLEPTFSTVRFICYDAPWTAYVGKYKVWKWRWVELFRILLRLRREKYDAVVSVRNDPRDHLFMWLIGARARHGFPLNWSRIFLNRPRARSKPKQHKVEDWRDMGRALGFPGMDVADPYLNHAQYHTDSVDHMLAGLHKPIICLHPGARIDVRRWPESHFARIIEKLRSAFDFHLVLVPDPDGYGAGLTPLADATLRPLTVRELVDVLGRVDLLICNDSGPGHIAAACGRPAIPIFGPTDPDWFRPWGKIHRVIIRDICPWRPCFDYCKFPEPHCLTKLLPDTVWPEIYEHISALSAQRLLPARLQRMAVPTSAFALER